MDAAALSNFHAPKLSLSPNTIEIIRQLLERFPGGVPPATTKTPSTHVSPARASVGRVEDELKTVRFGSKAVSPTAEANGGIYSVAKEYRSTNLIRPPSPVQANVGGTLGAGQDSISTTLVPDDGVLSEHSLSPTVSVESTGNIEDDDSSCGSPRRDLAPAEAVRLFIQDMAFVSANNKIYKAKASAMLLQAQKLRQQAAYLRASIEIEQTRRQRLVVDLEISTSDDEELVTAWHLPDNESRRKSTQRDKGKQRAVDVEELATDEEDFSSPFVSQSDDGGETTLDTECYVYPLM
ncbi:hypothetical protein B0H13DRAFT_1967228 [Mycena leptocephala]|nr:hypothetical protein B0H13DRAFT_1967228 [Mycena leptocephala]